MDVSYYTGAPAESLTTVDIVIGSGDIVSIDELPDDPGELIALLENENCSVKHWVLVAQAYALAGKLSDGATVASRGLEGTRFTDSDRVLLHGVLGWIHLRRALSGADKEAAVAEAEAQFKHIPTDSISGQLAAAVVAWRRGNAEKAQHLFDSLLQADAANCLALMGRAHAILARTRNYGQALRLYQQVLALNPTLRPDPRIGVGVCFWLLQDHEMAEKAWKRALELDPECHSAHVLLGLALFDDTFNRSISDEQFVEHFRTAMVTMTDLNQKYPADAVPLLALVPYFYAKKDHDLVTKIVHHVVANVTGAAGTSTKLLSHTSAVLSTASYWLGRVAHSAGDFPVAQKYFHEALRLDEGNVDARLGLAMAQLGRGVSAEATLTLETLLRTHPKCAEATYLLGTVYAEDNKPEQAVHVLERYVRMCGHNSEPVALNAWLTLSTLYEKKDLAQAASYLSRAVEARKQLSLDVPVEVHNNMGVFAFNRGNVESAVDSFKAAQEEAAKITTQLGDDLRITLAYNVARASEADPVAASKAYKDILDTCSHYMSAKLRLVFLDAVSTNETPKADIEKDLRALVAENPADLELRSFYGWFLRTFGRSVGVKPDADTAHHKATLVDYDSHDAYALMLLANLYCSMARDLRDDRRTKYYVRAIELYAKVLSVDPRNVFAAQGLAIVYIENKELVKGVDVLRKIRDLLNDISVYVNLGHALVELKQFAKAVENYEIALTRFTDGTDGKILAFLGRAWYLRGLADKSLPYLKKALEYAEDTVAKAPSSAHTFNVAFVQFQIADFVTKIPVEKRNVDDINDAILGLNDAIKLLNTMASDEGHAPYPKADLKARAGLGATLLNRLTTCLQETKDNISQINTRLEEAKKFREEQEALRAQQQEALLAEKKAHEEALAKERALLQEQAQQWADEARATVNSDDDKSDAEKEKKEKKEKKKKPKKGKKGKKKDFINDTEEEEDAKLEEEPEPEEPKLESESEGEDNKEKKPKKKRAVVSDDDEEETPPSKKKRVYKSEERVEDSSDDDNDDNDGLF